MGVAGRIAVLCALAAAPLLLPAQDMRQCEARVQSETARLEREFAKQRPDPEDRIAVQRWQRALQAQLQAVALEAEACRQRNRPEPTAAQSAAAAGCLNDARLQGEELARRYGGRELSPSEQLRLKNEEQKLSDKRQACARQTP